MARPITDWSRLTPEQHERVNRLSLQYQGIAWKQYREIVRCYPFLDRDELMCDLQYALGQAALWFDPNRGAFTTIATLVCKQRGWLAADRQIKRLSGLRRAKGAKILTLSEPVHGLKAMPSVLSELIEREGREQLCGWLREGMGTLNARERMVLRKHILENRTFEQIGREMKPRAVTRAQVNKIEKEALDKLYAYIQRKRATAAA